jgi:hypothetical protein
MRSYFFWAWFVVAVAALARLWSTVEGGLLPRFGVTDAVTHLVLLVAAFVLGRVEYRTARERRGK